MNGSENKKAERLHFCIFCEEKVKNIHLHFKSKHAREKKVRQILKIQDKKKRFWRWKKLRQEGDNYYNTKVSNDEEKIIVKDSASAILSRKYIDCSNCLGRIRASYKWHHKKMCEANLKCTKIDAFNGMPEELVNEFKKSLNLMSFIKYMSQDKGNEKIVRCLIADLIILEEEIQRVTKEKKPLTSFLKIYHMDKIGEAIKNLSGGMTDQEKIIKYPLRAQHFCRLVKNLCKFLVVYLNERNLVRDAEEINQFHSIFLDDPDRLIKNPMYKCIKISQLRKLLRMSKSIEVRTVVEKLKEETTDLVNILRKKKNPKAWRNLAENMLCRLAIFNKRRGETVEKMSVKDYTNTIIKTKIIADESSSYLTEEDVQFIRNFRIVEIAHKCDNLVPIFLNKKQKIAMEVLLKFRNLADINKDNPYFFAAGRDSLESIHCEEAMWRYRVLREEVEREIAAAKQRERRTTSGQVLDSSLHDEENWANRLRQKCSRNGEQVNGVLKTDRILRVLDDERVKQDEGKRIEERKVSVIKVIKKVNSNTIVDDSSISKTEPDNQVPSTSQDSKNHSFSSLDLKNTSTPNYLRNENKNPEDSSSTFVQCKQKRRHLEDSIESPKFSPTEKPLKVGKDSSDSEDEKPLCKIKPQSVKKNLSINYSEEKSNDSDTSGEWFTPVKSRLKLPNTISRYNQDPYKPVREAKLKGIHRIAKAMKYESESDCDLS